VIGTSGTTAACDSVCNEKRLTCEARWKSRAGLEKRISLKFYSGARSGGMWLERGEKFG